MMNHAAPSPGAISPDPIGEGDALARESRWEAAVARWLDGYGNAQPERRSAAEQRLRWLLRESGTSPRQHNQVQERRRSAYRVLLLGVLAGAIATALIIAGMYTEPGTSPVLAVGGWIGIIASMACAILYAFRLSSAAKSPVSAPLTADEIAQVRSLAELLDRDDSVSRPVAGDRHL